MAKTWQIILATVAIFFAGLVTGGATAIGVVRWVNHHRMMNGGPQGQFGQRPGQQFGPQLMRNFAFKLDLTPDQRKKIGAIVGRASRMMQDEIGDILSPEQKVKFDELISEHKARMQQLREMQQGFQQPVQAPAPTPAPNQP
jgi:Spy/CpxP family protein refolding chaperone